MAKTAKGQIQDYRYTYSITFMHNHEFLMNLIPLIGISIKDVKCINNQTRVPSI